MAMMLHWILKHWDGVKVGILILIYEPKFDFYIIILVILMYLIN